jgi:hypothetical protein
MSKELIDGDFYYESPYNDYGSNFKKIERLFKHININIVDEDYQFMCKFITINNELLTEIFETKNKSLYDNLVIPEALDYNVKYTVDGSCTFTEYYNDVVSSYDKYWVIDMLYALRDDGNWYEGEGNLVNTEYDNYDTSDFQFGKVTPILSESKPKSLLGRLVVENTSEVVSSLDKETLLELKQIIELRLRSI